jgi:hypothetical protein
MYLVSDGVWQGTLCPMQWQSSESYANYPHHVITYPSTGIGGVRVPSGYIKTLKACLTWDQFQRPAIEALLGQLYQLQYPDFETGSKVAISQEHLGAILQSVIRHCRASGLPTDPEVATWQGLFYDKIRLNGAGETDGRLDSRHLVTSVPTSISV